MTAPDDPLVAALRAALESAYDIESELTGGGMSRVFVATERALNRRVVIKVLPPEVAAGVNRERFRREIQLAAQLQHPHIVPLLAAGDTEGILYYTMPFIEGESLKHALARGSKFTAREVVGVLHDVADALAYAHERGVIHRDVKPANVLRTGVHALVADFGVAKALSASLPAVGMTTSGMAIGTPQYMAPEQLAGDPAADHRVDIYALGLLGYELLTGAPTFAGPSPQATMAAQLTREPAPIEPLRPDVPPALSRLLMRCLAKDPRGRPANAVTVRMELEAIVIPSGDYTPQAVPRRPGRSWLPVAALGGIALAALAVFAMRYRGQPSEGSGATTVTSAPPAATPVDSTSSAGTSGDSAPDASTPVASPPTKQADRNVPSQVLPAVGTNTRGGARGPRTALDSIADLVLLLKSQAPPDDVVRPPSPNAISRAGTAERQANLGPRRRAAIITLSDSASRDLARRVAAQLDPRRFDPSITENGASGREFLDSVAVASGYDVALYPRASLRRDSSWTGEIRLRDFTANANYATNQVSRRLPADSFAIAADTLAAQAARRLATMDGMPRAGVIDPELRAFQERARAMGPPRRIVIWNHPPHDNLQVQEAGSLVMDVLRTAIRSNSRFLQVPRDSTLSIVARSRNRETVLTALNADLMVSIAARYSPSEPDSVSWAITVRDEGATSAYSSRTFRSATVPLGSPLDLSAPMLAQVLTAIEQIDTAPRRTVAVPRG